VHRISQILSRPTINESSKKTGDAAGSFGVQAGTCSGSGTGARLQRDIRAGEFGYLKNLKAGEAKIIAEGTRRISGI